MTVITCKIPEDLDAKLEATARQRRVSKSSLVREALERHVGRPGSKRSKPSALDMVRHLCGRLHGPRDASTNPKYLEDLGA